MVKVYENLDEAFYGINRTFLTSPSEIVQFIRGSQGFTEDLIIRVKKPVTTLNLHEFAFDPKRKWSHLIKSYVDPVEYRTFWEKIKTVTGTSFQFRFKHKYDKNGPCLIAIVFTRPETGNEPWTKAKIIWRSAELQRKFAADMVLIHQFFKEIPEDVKHKVQIKEITMYLSQAFQSWRLVGPLIPLFCDMNEVDVAHDFGRKVMSTFERNYKPEEPPPCKFKPVLKMQKHYRDLQEGNIGYTHPDELSLKAELEKIERMKK